MKLQRNQMIFSLLAAAGILMSGPALHAAEAVELATIPVRMTVSASVANNKRMPVVNREDVLVKHGKERLQVTKWVSAQGERAGLDLFILIDDSVSAQAALQFDDLRAFINAQPSTTSVGVGYMRNSTVQIIQDLTGDHALAAQSLRLPLGPAQAYGSPYLSVVSLMNSWPASQNRHEVLMVTDGIDRVHRHIGSGRGYNTYPDVDTASVVAQRTGTNIHTIYFPNAGRFHRSYWEAMNGQTNLSRLSDKTGGESYYLGLHSPVSFSPYLTELQGVLANQYLLSFEAKPGKTAGLQSINLSTELAGVNLSAHDAVWVPASK